MNSHFAKLLCRAEELPVDREEALELFYEADKGREERELLYQTARKVRQRETGDIFRITGGISSVLPCCLKPLCLYCPYWRGEDREVVPLEAVIAAVRYFKREGIREFHLSGGTTLGGDGSDILAIVKGIWQADIREMEITVNCGAAMSVDSMKQLRQMGVVKVGAVFETGNRDVFAALKPGDNFEMKERFAWDIKAAGLRMHSGIMAGLGPKESRYKDYVSSLYYLKQFPHMKSLYISKFRPDQSIPMKGQPQCTVEEACTLVAVTRLVLRKTEIRIAAGWSGDEKEQGILAGGGGELCVLMLNHAGGYWNSQVLSDTREEARRMAADMGLKMAGGMCLS